MLLQPLLKYAAEADSENSQIFKSKLLYIVLEAARVMVSPATTLTPGLRQIMINGSDWSLGVPAWLKNGA